MTQQTGAPREADASPERLSDPIHGRKKIAADPGLARTAFKASLGNDLDISGALGAVFSLIKEVNRLLDRGEVTPTDACRIDDLLSSWDTVLGVIEYSEAVEVDSAHIEALIAERNRARKARDITRSDEIRDQLAVEGIIIQDTPEGTRWRRK